MTPFQALYSYEPPRWKEIIQGSTKVPVVKDQLEENQRIMKTLKDSLTMAQNPKKQQVDQHRTEREFELADWVFIRLQQYKYLSLKQQGKNKLAPKFYGPYQIIWNISNVAYDLKLPETS